MRSPGADARRRPAAQPCSRRTASSPRAEDARRRGARARRRHSPRLQGSPSESWAAPIHWIAYLCKRMHIHAMTDLKERRQRAIANLIRSTTLSSQEELADRLGSLGFAVTQATISRDLEQIGAVKVRRDGHLTYALPNG